MEIKLPELFVVAFIEDDVISNYYDTGPDGIEFSKNIENAKLFTSFEAARTVWTQLVEASQVSDRARDGVLYPHPDIHRALKMCDAKQTATATLSVLKLSGEFVTSTQFTVAIKKPTGYTYD